MPELLDDRQLSIVALGGGHGLAAVVEGLVTEFPEASTVALTTVADSGSATGRLRDLAGEVGDQPYGFGDLRNNLGRASRNLGGGLFGIRFGEDANTDSVRELNKDLLRAVETNVDEADLADLVLDDTVHYGDLLTGLRGHTFGNLVLAGLASRHGLVKGLNIANRWLDTGALVQTVTDTPHHMHMRDNGKQYATEAIIDDRVVEDPSSARIWLDEGTILTPEARESISNADILVVAPGSLWTSTLPVLAVEGIAEAISAQQLRPDTSRLAIANLVHEDNAGAMRLADYMGKIKDQTGADFTVIHNTAIEAIPPGYRPLYADGGLDGHNGYGARLVSAREAEHDPNDPLGHRRAGVFHDGTALVAAVRGAHELVYQR